MKLIITFGFVLALGLAVSMETSFSGTVKLPHQTEGQLAAKCKAAGGDFTSADGSYSCWGKKGAVLCTKKTCVGECASCGNAAASKTLPGIIGETKKKRPKVLQEGAGGNSGDVNPTVLNGDPRKTQTGNMPDIKGNSTI